MHGIHLVNAMKFARLHYVILNTFANSHDPLSNDGIILQDWNDLAQKQREDIDCGLHVDQKYECSKCNASFTRLADKRYHEDRCGTSVCLSCGAHFSNLLKLRIHQRVHDETNKCQICKKCFGTKQSLERHKLVHTDEKAFECDICKQEFTLKCNHKRHMKRKHPELV